jgi:hypothetical protein
LHTKKSQRILRSGSLANLRVVHAALPVLFAAILTTSGCGGGGSGGGGPTVLPTIPLVTATPVGPTPTPAPTTQAANVEVLLSAGDRIGPTNLSVSDIQDAALNEDGSVVVIVTVTGTNGARAVFTRSTSGTFTSLFEPGTAPAGEDLTSLGRLRVAPSGDVLFEGGSGIDTDRLFLAHAGQTQLLAGGAPGITSPTFRILGDVTIGKTGRIGFIGGGNPCQITTVNNSQRISCDEHLYVADGFSVTEATNSNIKLAGLSPNSPQVVVADSGATYFSIPGANSAPTILKFSAGALAPVVAADTPFPVVGSLVRPQVVAINGSDALLLTTTLTNDPGPTRPTVIGRLAGQNFSVIARAGDATSLGPATDLRALGLDDGGSALYLATVGTTADPKVGPKVLVVNDGGAPTEVATEGSTFQGTDLTVLSVEAPRINRAGDVVYLSKLGQRDSGTTTVAETRVIVHFADGRPDSVVSSRGVGTVGGLRSLKIAGFNEDGSLLVIGLLDSSANRVLLKVDPLGS